MYYQLSVCWNVYPVLIEGEESAEETLHIGIRTLKQQGVLEKGDTVLLSGGPQTKISGHSQNKALGGVIMV